MKSLPLFFIILSFCSEALAQALAYPGMNLREIDRPVFCHPPSQAFFEEKLRRSFHFETGEKELKEVVSDPRNYSAREEVKTIKRQMVFANRIQSNTLREKLPPKFESMIDVTNRRGAIRDFPVEGSSANLGSSEDGALEISMENLSKEDLEFLPPTVLNKIGNKVKIKYQYPLDRFDYVVSYDGKDLPMERAFGKIQDDFEYACERNALEGQFDREKRQWKIKNGSGTGGGSAQ